MTDPSPRRVPGQPSGSETAPAGAAPGSGGRAGRADTPGSVPDPLKAFRGPVAAALVLEVIVVLLTLLVVGKFGGQNGGGLGIAVVVALAAVMIGLVRFAGRAWAPYAAAGLQLVMIALGFVVFALAVVGVIFGLVWLALLMMRRDLAGKQARGELPGQR